MDYESSGLTAGPIYINNIRTPIPRVCDWLWLKWTRVDSCWSHYGHSEGGYPPPFCFFNIYEYPAHTAEGNFGFWKIWGVKEKLFDRYRCPRIVLADKSRRWPLLSGSDSNLSGCINVSFLIKNNRMVGGTTRSFLALFTPLISST